MFIAEYAYERKVDDFFQFFFNALYNLLKPICFLEFKLEKSKEIQRNKSVVKPDVSRACVTRKSNNKTLKKYKAD